MKQKNVQTKDLTKIYTYNTNFFLQNEAQDESLLGPYNRDVPEQEWLDSDGEPDQPALDSTFNISNRDIHVEEDPEPQEE